MATKKSIEELSCLQDACIRVVCKKSKCCNVVPLYRKLNTLCLNELITLELAKYGYKISHKLYPAKVHENAEAHGGLKQHRYPTRYKNTPNIQKHTTIEFNHSILCKGLTVYNGLPVRLKEQPTLKRFTKEVKKHLMSTY